MLSEFWKTAYIRMFDGSGQLIPSIYPQTNMSLFTSLGKILSHGYMISRVMPLQITFPTFASVLLGPGVKVDDDMLITCLANSVSASESQLIRGSLKVNSGEFDNDTRDKLVNLLSRYDARVIPTPCRFKTELIQIHKYQFLIKPIPAVISMHEGIVYQERKFWASFSVANLYSLYNLLTADPDKLLKVIEEPQMNNPGQERVCNYLRQYISLLPNDELQIFLHFVTGSTVMPTHSSGTFNSLSGAARRPISHTCANTIELSTGYITYLEFVEEMKVHMNKLSRECSWSMDTR